jgi:small subunit ribosomal protein S19e
MVNIYDVNQAAMITQLAEDLKASGKIKIPEWALFVKTGSNKERAPLNKDWWYFRAASILRRIYLNGPIGVSKLRTKYGSNKNRGVKPGKFVKASGKIIRVLLQQLEAAKYIAKEEKADYKGRIIAPAGASLIDKVAGKVKAAPATKKQVPKDEQEKQADAPEKKQETGSSKQTKSKKDE